MKKNTFIQHRYKALGSAALFVLAFLFWWLWLPEVTAYHEQNQMFLLTADYLVQHLTLPGALADYASEALVQFSFFVAWGAAIAALLLTLMQRVAWRIMRQCGAGDAWYGASFALPLLTAAQSTDPDTLPTFTLALLAALTLAWARIAVHGKRRAWLFDLVATPLAYWVLGPVSAVIIIAALACAVVPQLRGKATVAASLETFFEGIVTTLLVAWPTGVPMQYSWGNMAKGLFYYRQPDTLPLTLGALIALAAMWPFAAAAMARAKSRAAALSVSAAAVVTGLALTVWGTQRRIISVIDYSYMVRTSHYADIIKKSGRTAPTSEIGVAATNLALSATGQMPDRMFEFRQTGEEGLLPRNTLDLNTTLLAGEIYLHLGLVNEAQRFFFEAQEAVPGYKRSARCYRRLADTNLVNGDYAVAARYLRLLSHTLFYRQWAQRRMEMVQNHSLIVSDPEYSRLRKSRIDEDYLFGVDTDMMLGKLYVHNTDNHAALEYLMAFELVTRNAERFMKYFPIVLQAAPNHMPRSYQEAIAAFTMKQPQNKLAQCVDATTRQQFSDFLDIYVKNPKAAAEYSEAPFADTYWFYLFNSNAAAGSQEQAQPSAAGTKNNKQ